jgi:hypothetical protein
MIIAKYEFIPNKNELKFLSYSDDIPEELIGIKPDDFEETGFIKSFNSNSYIFYLGGDEEDAPPAFIEILQEIHGLIGEVQKDLYILICNELKALGYDATVTNNSPGFNFRGKTTITEKGTEYIEIKDLHGKCILQFSTRLGDELSVIKTDNNGGKRFDFSNLIIDKLFIGKIVPIHIFPVNQTRYDDANVTTYFYDIEKNTINQISFDTRKDYKISSTNFEKLLQQLVENRLIFDYERNARQSAIFYYVFNEILQSKKNFMRRMCADLDETRYDRIMQLPQVVDAKASPQLILIEKLTGKQMSIYFSKKRFNYLLCYDTKLSVKIFEIKIDYLAFNHDPSNYNQLLNTIFANFNNIYTLPDDKVNYQPSDKAQHSPESFYRENVIGVMDNEGNIYTKAATDASRGKTAKQILTDAIPEFQKAEDFDQANALIIVDQPTHLVLYLDKKDNKVKSKIVFGRASFNSQGVLDHAVPIGVKTVFDHIKKKYWNGMFEKVGNMMGNKANPSDRMRDRSHQRKRTYTTNNDFYS